MSKICVWGVDMEGFLKKGCCARREKDFAAGVRVLLRGGGRFRSARQKKKERKTEGRKLRKWDKRTKVPRREPAKMETPGGQAVNRN